MLRMFSRWCQNVLQGTAVHQNSLTTVKLARGVSAASSPIRNCEFKWVKTSNAGKRVQIGFSDEAAFEFHGLWLRDACRDSNFVAGKAGERFLNRIPVETGCTGQVSEARLASGSEMNLSWLSDAPEMQGLTSSFSSGFLRMYGPVAGRDLSHGPVDPEICKDFEWLMPYSGYVGTLAPPSHMLQLWSNKGIESTKPCETDQFQHRDFSEVMNSDSANLEMLKALMMHGVVILDNVPAVSDSSLVLEFASKCMGGMQKDPARDEPNWVIRRKQGAQSVSYAQERRLNNHTDQSVPAHGIPALCLVVHYVSGSGKNTLVDSYSVFEAMKARNPRAVELLSTYGNCQERDFVASRVDSVQRGTQNMLVSTKQPIFQTDKEGKIIRAQYNEVFRTPSTVPFEKFEDWYAAYALWNEMIHSPEFEVEVAINAGQILVLNNWRVLHGRAGAKSSADRCIMGGTVVREAFHSKAVQLLGASLPIRDNAA